MLQKESCLYKLSHLLYAQHVPIL